MLSHFSRQSLERSRCCQCVFLLIGMVAVSTVNAADNNKQSGFYTVVDSQGRLIVIPSDNVKTKQSASKSNNKVSAKVTTTNLKKLQHKQSQPIQQVEIAPTAYVSSKPADYTKAKSTHALSQSVPKQTAKTPQVAADTVVDNNVIDSSRQSESSSQQTQTAEAPRLTISTDNTGQSVQARKGQGTELVTYQETDYVDSQVLIDKSFNVDGKKRFYALPNSSGSVDFVERESGVNIRNIVPERLGNQLFSTASGYERIPAKALITMLPSRCVSLDDKKKLKKLSSKKPVNIWPRNVKTERFHANYVALASDATQINLLSYANKANEPTFYWPFVVFLDRQGCVIEGVGNFYQADIPATWLQQTAIKGNLLVPENASYLMMTPLEQSPDMAKKTLVKYGQLKLSVFDGLNNR